MKSKIIKLLLPIFILSIVAVGYLVSSSNILYKDKTIVLSKKEYEIENTIDIVQLRNFVNLKNVTALLHFDGENRIILGMNKEYDKIKTQLDNCTHDKEIELHRKLSGSTYQIEIDNPNPSIPKYNLTNLKVFDITSNSGYSPDREYIDFMKNDKNYIYEISSGKTNEYKLKSLNNSVNDNQYSYLIGNWTEDSNFLIKYNKANHTFYIINKTGNIEKSINLNDRISYVNNGQYYSTNGENIYFIGRKNVKNTEKIGLYHLNTKTESITSILELDTTTKTQAQNALHNFQFLDNNTVVFDALVESVSGLYLYDINTHKISKLFASDGINFSIAPDQNKIVYSVSQSIRKEDTFEYDNDIYVANIDKNGLHNISYVKKNSFATSYKWSDDSKKLVFYESNTRALNYISFK
ncbi:hypothetical protein PV797_16050 [Clostridiaceae bacterium M8S5]|nr:hypothetical protein PV797_16050 [Clostridiaceae bacterium M8S5]